jgi:hypothetical protein
MKRTTKKNKKHNKKKFLLLALLLPFGFLGTAAGTVGILYASGVINPTVTKTNIKSIFNQDTTH